MDTPAILLVPRGRAIEELSLINVTAQGLVSILIHLVLALLLVAIELIAPHLVSTRIHSTDFEFFQWQVLAWLDLVFLSVPTTVDTPPNPGLAATFALCLWRVI